MSKLSLLLTGGGGMVGRNVLDVAQTSAFADRYEIKAPLRAELDLMDAEAVFKYVQDLGPDVVVHTAGKVGGIAANIASPVQFLDDNLVIGRNIIMAALNANVPRLINLGSSCMYPRKGKIPLTEDLILSGPLEPTNEGYALAKTAALRLCQYIRREHSDRHYKTLIPCNLYGPHDKFDPHNSHLLPAIIHKIHHAKKRGDDTVEIWGKGDALREFIYAGDLADFILSYADNAERLPDVMNIAAGGDNTINHYYHVVAKVLGWDGTFTHDLSKPVGMHRKLCSTLRQEDLGWTPATPLEDGIRGTYAAYLKTPYARTETS